MPEPLLGWADRGVKNTLNALGKKASSGENRAQTTNSGQKRLKAWDLSDKAGGERDRRNRQHALRGAKAKRGAAFDRQRTFV